LTGLTPLDNAIESDDFPPPVSIATNSGETNSGAAKPVVMAPASMDLRSKEALAMAFKLFAFGATWLGCRRVFTGFFPTGWGFR
jgi:hypothetical protein